MLMSSHLLKRGITLWKNGDKIQSHKLFETIIYNDRQNEAAWIWYVYTLEGNKGKIAALENFLTIFPQHGLGRQALENLRMEEDQQRLKLTNSVAPSESKYSLTPKPVPVKEAHPRQTSYARPTPWLLIVLGICLLFFASTSVMKRYNSLKTDNTNLIVNNQLISRNLATLQNEHELAKSSNLQLTNQYNSLADRYNQLNNEYSSLSKNYETLYSEHSQLIEEYNSLTGDYNYLNDIAVKPPYIVVHDRMVDTTFYDTDGQLITWTTPFSGLEYSFERGTSMRSLIVDNEWQTILVHTQDDRPLWIRDVSIFVTPTTFEKVVPELYTKSSTAYEFIYRLWYIIGQLSNYASEEIETPRYSLETLLAGGGDCEDLSILFASLVQAAPVDWYVDLIYVDSTSINHPQEPDHVVVYIDTGQETYIVETTNDQVMLPYTNGVTGWLAGDLNSGDNYPTYLR